MHVDLGRARELKERSLAVLLKNRRTTRGHQYTVPSPTSYPYQWLWDSCFHAVVLAHESPEDAKEELRSLFSHQFENGMLPHMIYWEKKGVLNIPWGKGGQTSSITQPPLVAEAVWSVYEKTGDKNFLKEAYPHLYHFYNYLLTERDPRQYHLIGIINPDESGEDNSPRFDHALDLPPRQTKVENYERRLALVRKLQSCDFDAPFCMKHFFWVKDVPFNSILVKNLAVLAKISETAGLSEEGLHFAEQGLRITRSMREHMLDGGVYWSTEGEHYQKIMVKTWAMFAPLFAKLLPMEDARGLVKKYLFNPAEFGTHFSVPTVAKSEASYDPEGFWRGPVWMSTNWFVYCGLLEYGFVEEAERILESSMQLLEQSGFREYFHPDTGEGLGAEDFTWGALIVDMLERAKRI